MRPVKPLHPVTAVLLIVLLGLCIMLAAQVIHDHVVQDAPYERWPSTQHVSCVRHKMQQGMSYEVAAANCP